jgi:hypothetical protein
MLGAKDLREGASYVRMSPMPDNQQNLDHIGEWAYDEALRGLDQQRSALDDLRARAGAILSAGVLATAFLGAFAVHGTGRGLAPRFWGPVVLFIVAALLFILILLPVPGWFYSINVRGELDQIDPANPPSLFNIYDKTVTAINKGREDNQKQLTLIYVGFVFASLAVAAEIVWWLVEVI